MKLINIKDVTISSIQKLGLGQSNCCDLGSCKTKAVRKVSVTQIIDLLSDVNYFKLDLCQAHLNEIQMKLGA